MTIQEALDKCDNLKPNIFSAKDKIIWLSNLDGVIKQEIIDTHEGYEEINFTGYDGKTPLDTVLLAPEPYSDLYIMWLFTQIDFNNAEFERYNNSIIMYNNSYSIYAAWYNRSHMPLQKNTVKF